MDSYKQAPADYRVRPPVLDRTEVLKTNYSLGEAKTEYQSSAMQQFNDPIQTAAAVKKAQPIFKNYNKRIDIITGQILNNNYKSSGYEAFTENKQSRTSGDRCYMPQDIFVTCPITGRRIIAK